MHRFQAGAGAFQPCGFAAPQKVEENKKNQRILLHRSDHLMDTFFESLIQAMQPGQIERVRIGLHWTLVTARVGDEIRAGLATTLPSVGHHHRDWPDVREAGELERMDARALADLLASPSPVERSVGLATINALLPRQPQQWQDINAEEVIARAGAEKTVVIVGHFPFTQRLRERVGKLVVLELAPRGEDLPAEQAPVWIPRADVLAITSVTILNHTLADLLALRRPDALTLMLGPSTPLHPLMYDLGVDILSGSIVTDIGAVTQKLCQGAGFRQIQHAGVRLVTLER
jgi:uncharacterized protein (DUF4213/DUF364 family)